MSLELLLDELDAFVEACRGEVTLTPRGAVSDEVSGEALDCVELGPRGGEWVEVGVGAGSIRLRFAGWVEVQEVASSDPEVLGDARALVLDFVAAAIFGELRVIELRLRGEVLRRVLEVCVDGTWRRHAKRGKLGLGGARAWIRRDLERRVRSNEGRVPRPRPLRDAGPRGLPGAPWAGAAMPDVGAAAPVEIDGELDLHNFSPKEVAPLVREYIEVCRGRGIRDLRIVHGKGKGVLRRTVHALLDKHEAVESYRLGGHGEGSWGATIVRLREDEDESEVTFRN